MLVVVYSLSLLVPQVVGVAEGLAYLHSQGVIHADLNPVRITACPKSQLSDLQRRL
jgi:serine/threonine protein kinase